jgi:hypothetical protein
MKKKSLAAALFISLLFGFFISFLVFGRGIDNLRTVIIGGLVVIFHVFILFMILYTGNLYKWRKIFFTSYAVAFVISFVWWTMGDRGHMWLLDSELLYSQAPMCHIVVPMLILPIIFTKEVIFSGILLCGFVYDSISHCCHNSFRKIVLCMGMFFRWSG